MFLIARSAGYTQMDQAKPANQNIFWHDRKRGEDANLDSDFCLCPRSHHQERTRNQSQFNRNPANPQHYTF